MEKYGNPITFGGGQNADLPPLLDNFKAFEGGGTDDGLTRLKDLPNGTKVKFGTYNSQTLVWRIAQDEGVTKAVLDLDYDTGKTVIGDMVVSPANSFCGNWAITGWLNATESGSSWWANRVHYEDSEYPETEPTYSSQDGFLHGWSESDRGLLQNIEWGCDDFILGGSPEPYQLNCKLMICSEDEAYAAWNGERFCVGFGADTPVILRDYSIGAGGYSGISGMGSSTMEGAVYKDELSSTIGIWPVCAPNPEAVVSDEPDDDGCYTISNKRSTVKDLQLGDKIKVAVNPEFQSEFGNYMVFEKVDQDHEGYPENSSTFMAKNITMVRAMEGIYVYNTAMDFSLTALSQYLNSDAGAGEWFQELIEGQVPPDGTDSSTLDPDYAYADKPGFFNVLDNNFTNKLLPTNIEHSTKKVYFFVPSVVEMGVKDQNNETWSSAETISSPFKWFDSDDKRTRALTSEVVSTYPDYKNELMAADESASYEANSPYYYTLRNMLNGNVFPIIRTDGTISPTNYVVGKGSCGICPVCNISNDLFLTLQEPDEDGCYIVDYTKIAVTIQADKMEESRAKELAGAVWVYGDHIPKNVNDGTKIQLTREDVVVSRGSTVSTFALSSTKTLNDLPSGSKVKLGKYNDTELQWKVARDTVDQSLRLVLEPVSITAIGRLMYDNAEPSNGDSKRRQYDNNRYIWSNIHQWLNSDKLANNWYTAQHGTDTPPDYQNKAGFMNEWGTLDKDAIAYNTWSTTKSSVDGGGKETFQSKITLLSTTELGVEDDTGNNKLDIFQSSADMTISAYYYTRTPNDTESYYVKSINPEGKLTSVSHANNGINIRPICVPKPSVIISTEPDSDGCYIIIGLSEKTEKSVSWEQTKDFYVRQFTYNSKKQYQTMLEGAILKNIPSQLITNLSSNDKIKIGRYNNESMQWRLTKDTVTNDLYVVLEPISVKSIDKMIFDSPEPENSDEKRKLYGNNRYIFSNAHQWLNTDGLENQWYVPQHSVDTPPPYSNKKGFLNEWNDLDKKSILTNTYTVTKASMDGGGTETFESKLCLMSTSEIGIKTGTGGNKLDIFNSDEDRKMDDWYFLRSPYYSLSDNINIISSTGALSSYRSDMEGYIRPMFKINTKMLVSLEKDSDGCYNIKGVEE